MASLASGPLSCQLHSGIIGVRTGRFLPEVEAPSHAGLFEETELLENVSQSIQRIGVIRLNGHSLLVGSERFIKSTDFREQVSQIVPGIDMLPVNFHGVAV